MTLAQRGSLAVDAAEPGFYVVRASGRLDRSTATRVVRLVDARARLTTLEFTTTRHILVDLSNVAQVEPGALDLLRHARRSATGAGMTLHLTGCDAVAAAMALRERQALATLARFPTVAVAVEVLGAAG
jgi:ABC-type transporter Mla MlaB component